MRRLLEENMAGEMEAVFQIQIEKVEKLLYNLCRYIRKSNPKCSNMDKSLFKLYMIAKILKRIL